MTTGEIIKEMRERRGLSQEELAKAAGYKDRSMIAKIESGSSDPSQRMLKRLAEALEVSPSELLDSPKSENVLLYEENDRVITLSHMYQDMTPEQRAYMNGALDVLFKTFDDQFKKGDSHK